MVPTATPNLFIIFHKAVFHLDVLAHGVWVCLGWVGVVVVVLLRLL